MPDWPRHIGPQSTRQPELGRQVVDALPAHVSPDQRRLFLSVRLGVTLTKNILQQTTKSAAATHLRFH